MADKKGALVFGLNPDNDIVPINVDAEGNLKISGVVEGGGGGGEVTIADGADTALGAKADAAAASDSATASLISLFKRLLVRITSIFVTATDAPASNAQGLIARIAGVATSGGISNPVELQFTVTSGSAYASGNCIGSLMTVTNAVRVNGGTGMLYNLMLRDRSNQKPACVALIFNDIPLASTTTDKQGFVLADADESKLAAVIPIGSGDWKTLPNTTKAVTVLGPIGRIVATSALSRNMYLLLVSDGATPTFTATTAITGRIKFLND